MAPVVLWRTISCVETAATKVGVSDLPAPRSITPQHGRMLCIFASDGALHVKESSMRRFPWHLGGLVVLTALALWGLFLITQPAQADRAPSVFVDRTPRSEERRVGKEWRSRL